MSGTERRAEASPAGGNGRSSDVPDEDFTHEAVVDDLDALREHLGIARWAVLAQSFGGLIAQLYALKHPDRSDSWT